MCNKAIENYPHALEQVSECCKTQKISDKAVDTYPFTIKFLPECYKTKEMCHRAVHIFVFDSIPDKYKTQEICNLAVSLHFPFIVYCPYKHITQEIFDEAVNDSLAALKLIPNWFVASKMIKKLFTALYVDENILYLMKILVMLYLIIMKWVLLILILIILVLMIILMKKILIILFLSDFWPGILNLKNAKNLKKN